MRDRASAAANGATGSGADSAAEGTAGNVASQAAKGTANSSAGNSMNTQIFRFLVVGVFCAGVDFGTTALCTWGFGLDDAWSKTIGFILGTLTAYLINRRWTFQAEPSFKRFAVTMITYGLTYLVQLGLYMVSIPWLEAQGLNEFWVRVVSFVIAQGTATVLNFLLQKFIIFRA